MTSEEKIINGRTVYIFGDDAPSAMVIQPVGDHEGYTDKLYREIKKITEKSMCFTTFKVTDWNSEMSPWDALPVFGEERFGHDAGNTLNFILKDLIPYLKQYCTLPDRVRIILGGYSLAGLFSLWASYQTDIFDGIYAASPSVWFDQWIEYARENDIYTRSVYLSLGDTESKTGHPVLKTVGDRILEMRDILIEKGVETIFESNTGNHFKDRDIRCAKGIKWCIEHIDK